MKHLLYLLAIVLSGSCTHKVYRSSYRFNALGYEAPVLVIKKNMTVNDSLYYKVGEIRLSDGWWVMDCSEQDAIDLLKKEAHQLRANVINITKEKHTDLKSSCYRCEAEFYRFSGPGVSVQSDSTYSEENLALRNKQDNRKKAWLFAGSVATGIIVGTLLTIYVVP